MQNTERKLAAIIEGSGQASAAHEDRMGENPWQSAVSIFSVSAAAWHDTES
jgi:hypothetical protein